MKKNDEKISTSRLTFSDIGEAVNDYQKPNFPMVIATNKYEELLAEAQLLPTKLERFDFLCTSHPDGAYFKFDESTGKYGLWLTWPKNHKKDTPFSSSKQNLGMVLILLKGEMGIIEGEIKVHGAISGNNEQITTLVFTIGLDDRKHNHTAKFLFPDLYLGWSHDSLNQIADMFAGALMNSTVQLTPVHSIPQFVFSSLPAPMLPAATVEKNVEIAWLCESADFAKLEAIKQMDINPTKRLHQLVGQEGLMSKFENGYAAWMTMPELLGYESRLKSRHVLVKLEFIKHEAMFVFEAEDIDDIRDEKPRLCMATTLIDLTTKRLTIDFIEANFVNGWTKVLLQHLINYFTSIATERPSPENRKRRAVELTHWSSVLGDVPPQKRIKGEEVPAKKAAAKKKVLSYAGLVFQNMLDSASKKNPKEKLEYLVNCAGGYLKDKKPCFHLEWDLGGQTRTLLVAVYQAVFESTIEEQTSFVARAGKNAEGEKYFYIKINELINGEIGKDSILHLRISPDIGSCEIMYVHAGSEKLPKDATLRLTGNHVISGECSLLGLFGKFLPINYWVLHDAAQIKVPSYQLSISKTIPDDRTVLNNPQTIYLFPSKDKKIEIAALNGFYKIVRHKLEHNSNALTKGHLTQNETQTIFNKLEKFDYTLTQYEEIPLNLKNLLENRKSYYGEKLGMDVIDSTSPICLLSGEAYAGDKDAVKLKHEVLIIRKASRDYVIGYLDKSTNDYAESILDKTSRADSSLISYLDTLEFDGRIYTYDAYDPKNKAHVDLYKTVSQRIAWLGGDIYVPVEKCSVLRSSSPGAVQVQSRAQYYQACRALFEMNLSSLFLAADEDHKRLLIYLFISNYNNHILSLDETSSADIARTYETSQELLSKLQEMTKGLNSLDSPEDMRQITRFFADETLGSFWMTQKKHKKLIEAWRFIKLTPEQLSQPLLYHYRSSHSVDENPLLKFKQYALTVSATRAFECRGPLKH